MAEGARRQTRSQTAASRAQSTPGPHSSDDEVPASIRSKASARRSIQAKPLLKVEPSGTYGSKGQKNLAQQLSAQQTMNKAVSLIQTEVAGPVPDPARRLSTVNEEGEGGNDGDQHARVVDRGNVSGKEKGRSASKLTAIKSFDREIIDEIDVGLPPRDDATHTHVLSQGTSRFARLRAYLVLMSSTFFSKFVLFLMAVIAFVLVSMWVGWRPLDTGFSHVEYNKTFVGKEFKKMTSFLEGQASFVEGQARLLDDRFETRDRRLTERIEELFQTQDQRLDERLDATNQHVDERLDATNQHVDERMDAQDRRVDERMDEQHRVMEKLKNDFESMYIKFRQPTNDRINYFSRGLAAVSTRFSSPTLANPLTFKEKLATVRLELGKLPTWQTEKPVFEDPMSIFYPWETFGQKWCAPSRRGKLQAVVRLAYKIAPTEIMIEHMGKSQMPDVEIGTAPKEVELWIQVLDEEVRRKIVESITAYHPAIMTKQASQRGKTLDPRQALDKTWVPVGQWTYDIHARGNIQLKPIALDLKAMGVKTQAVAVRVNSNWGSVDSTCLYRVRLYGHYQEEPTEYTDLEEIPDAEPFNPWKRFRARHPRQ